MLNFDEERFLRIQSGAVGLAPELRRIVQERLAAGERNLFFVGTGGVAVLMHPAARLLQTRSTLPTYVEGAAELVAVGNRHLGPGSLVVMPSLSGTTPETLTALAYCQERGATVLSLTGNDASPLAQGADLNLSVAAADDTSSESYYLQSLLLALALLAEHDGLEDYDELVAGIDKVPAALLDVKRQVEASEAGRIAGALAADPYHIIVGAGSTWPEAFYYGTCILEEMQWIRTRPIHASDFFHGTLELVEDGVSVVLLKGEDETRGLVERVEVFLPPYTKNVITLDAADYPLNEIPYRLRALVSPVVLATVLERVSAHLEVLRDHPLTTRRYYRRVDY